VTTAPVRIAVLASGSGTNLQALIDADLAPAELAVVVGNVPGAGALERAARAGIPAEVVDHQVVKPRRAFDAELVRRLDAHRVEWVVLAGFMRVLTEVVLERFPDRVVNIHPALLPAFPGLDGQGQALRAGVKIAGCTVHLVDAGVDTGPILAQTAVPVLPDDTEDTLRDRILAEEHALLPAVVRALAEGRLERAGGRAWLRGAAGAGALRSGLP
jgi:phosphoribosylglycinamide formyltransferase-1